MPKDLIHFKIAQRAADKLRETKFAPCLEAHSDALLLGSVFHDALYYGVTPSANPLEKLTHALHGADGQDTFTLLRLQAEHAAASDSNGPAVAILVGLISHVYADILMHPMVWHFSGDYYATDPNKKSLARQRHRALESLMDMVACPEMVGLRAYSLRRMLSDIESEFAEGIPLAQLAELAGISRVRARKGIKSAWSIFAGFQRLYPIQPLAKSLFALRPWLPKAAAELATLFYAPQLLEQKQVVVHDITFKHPVTGKNKTTTLDALMEMAADKTCELCQSLEAGIFRKGSLTFPGTGPSLDAGLAGVPTSDMLHYSHPPFPSLP